MLTRPEILREIQVFVKRKLNLENLRDRLASGEFVFINFIAFGRHFFVLLEGVVQGGLAAKA